MKQQWSNEIPMRINVVPDSVIKHEVLKDLFIYFNRAHDSVKRELTN
jgi:hypothetical protein